MSGGGKETPRQKMIGVMYLVLTAMLALNVSAEVLNAFQLFEERLSQTVKVFGEKNDALEVTFRAANAENVERVQSWLNKALKVREMSKQMVRYMEDIKVEMVKAGDGPDAPAVVNNAVVGKFLINLSNTDASSHIMLNNGRGKELKDKIGGYKNELLKLINPSAKAVIAGLEETLETPDLVSDNTLKTWEVANFSELPLVAAVPILTKLQLDITNCEADVMSYLLSQADVGTVKIDNFDPIVQSVSDYVIRGGEFDAKIFLAASDKSLKPTVVVNNQTLKIVDGKAQYKVSAYSVGEQQLKGTITLNGKPYPFTYKYMVAEPNVVVSPAKMNVLYRGVENPIDISAAGIPDNKIVISVGNGTLTRQGVQYIIKPGEGTTCDVTVIAEINGAKNNMGKKIFRVKNVPVPVPEMDGISGNSKPCAADVIAGYQSLHAARF